MSAPENDLSLVFPDFSLILLIGPAGVGKSTWASQHFLTTEILSSDGFRAMISDDPANQDVSGDAFALLHRLLALRLKQRRLTVVDATNLRSDDRSPLIAYAQSHNCPIYAVAFDRALDKVLHQNSQRDRTVPEDVVQRHFDQFQALKSTKDWRADFSRVIFLDDAALMRPMSISRIKMHGDYSHLKGPFDVIGDVHGCVEECQALIDALGYCLKKDDEGWSATHCDGRVLVFVGDLVDRGPASPEVLELVMDLSDRNQALCVLGNHDDKLMRYLQGRNVSLTHGLEVTVEQLKSCSQAFLGRAKAFLENLPLCLSLDAGGLMIAHAAFSSRYLDGQGRGMRSYFLYGPVSGKRTPDGLPDRIDWAPHYKGNAVVAYGHTPVRRARRIGKTVNLDTGCVYGGALSALRYPENTVLSVEAMQAYVPMIRGYLGEGQ